MDKLAIIHGGSGMSIFDHSVWQDESGETYDNPSAFTKGPLLERGGKTARYSKRVVLDCESDYESIGQNYTAPFPVENIAVFNIILTSI
jgi:hypothetical protein